MRVKLLFRVEKRLILYLNKNQLLYIYACVAQCLSVCSFFLKIVLYSRNSYNQINVILICKKIQISEKAHLLLKMIHKWIQFTYKKYLFSHFNVFDYCYLQIPFEVHTFILFIFIVLNQDMTHYTKIIYCNYVVYSWFEWE